MYIDHAIMLVMCKEVPEIFEDNQNNSIYYTEYFVLLTGKLFELKYLFPNSTTTIYYHIAPSIL